MCRNTSLWSKELFVTIKCNFCHVRQWTFVNFRFRHKHCPKLILEILRPYTQVDLMNMSTMSKMSTCSLSSRMSHTSRVSYCSRTTHSSRDKRSAKSSLASRMSLHNFSLTRQSSSSSILSHSSSVRTQDDAKPKRRKLQRIASFLSRNK